MLCLLQRVNTLQLIGVKDMDKKKREGLKSPSLFILIIGKFLYKLIISICIIRLLYGREYIYNGIYRL